MDVSLRSGEAFSGTMVKIPTALGSARARHFVATRFFKKSLLALGAVPNFRLADSFFDGEPPLGLRLFFNLVAAS